MFVGVEILALRREVWAHIPHRDHRVLGIFTLGTNDLELMVHGEVHYEHHAGHETMTEWAARASLEKEDGGRVRMKQYQIIIVSFNAP